MIRIFRGRTWKKMSAEKSLQKYEIVWERTPSSVPGPQARAFGLSRRNLAPTLIRDCSRPNPQARLKKLFHPRQNLRRVLRFINRLAQPRPARNPMREPRRKLLHLPSRVRQFFLNQHAEISADHLVPVAFRRLIVTPLPVWGGHSCPTSGPQARLHFLCR